MSGLDFRGFEQQLRRAGIAPRQVRRTVAELDDHYNDLLATLQRRGYPAAEARRQARRQLGKLREIGAVMAARRELKCWYLRWPRAARIVYPVAFAAALPVLPVVAGVQHAPSIARWSACLLLSAGFTTTLLLLMGLSIAL